MRKQICQVWGLALAIPVGVLFIFGQANEAAAEVNVSINLGPPPIVVAAPPHVVMIPGSQVYFVPHPEIDVFFYNDFWWSPRGSHWYHSRNYNGPWLVVDHRNVPPPVFRVPKDYRVVYKHQQQIPYGQWKKQREHQEREQHQERDQHQERNDDRNDHKQNRGHN
jgi:hypothetical protein